MSNPTGVSIPKQTSDKARAAVAARTKRALIKTAAEAYADLNIFAACVAILEGGTVSADAQPDDFKVIALCLKAQQRCLKRYDRAMAALGAPYPEKSYE